MRYIINIFSACSDHEACNLTATETLEAIKSFVLFEYFHTMWHFSEQNLTKCFC